MKKLVFWMVALLLVSSAAMAQEGRRGGERMDAKTRAQRMTERMVKEYSMTPEQQKQLQEVNLAWVEKMGDGQNRRSQNDRSTQMTKEEREKRMADAKKSREDYEAQLKKVMTKDQYDSYIKKQAEREKQMQERRQNRQRR